MRCWWWARGFSSRWEDLQCIELVYSLLPRPKPKSPARTLASRSVAGTPLDRTPGKGPDPMPLSGTQGLYMWTSPTSEATPQSKASPSGTQGRPHHWSWQCLPPWPSRSASWMGVYGCMYLSLAVPRSRFTYLSLDLLSRSPPHSGPFPGPAQDCSVLLNRGTWGG